METREEISTHDEHDQDSSISFEDDADSISSQEDELEDWNEYINRSAREADERMHTNKNTNWVETQKKLKWRQALWLANQRPDRGTRKAAEVNPGLIISKKSR